MSRQARPRRVSLELIERRARFTFEYDSVPPSQPHVTVEGEELDERPTLRKCATAPVVSLDLYRKAAG